MLHVTYCSPPVDWDLVRTTLNKLQADAVDISGPLKSISALGPEAKKAHYLLFEQLEKACKDWGEAICDALAETVEAELDYHESDEYALERIENDAEGFEFSEDGKLLH